MSVNDKPNRKLTNSLKGGRLLVFIIASMFVWVGCSPTDDRQEKREARASRLADIGADALKANDLSLAADSYATALANDPTNDRLRRILAEVHAKQVINSSDQQPAQAQRLQQEFYEALLIGGGDRSLLLTAFGKMLLDRGFTGLAKERLKEAIELNGERLATHLYLGKAFIREQAWDKAEEAIGKAVKLKPEAAGVNFAMGQIKIAQKEWDKAAEFYAKAASTLDNGFMWGELGKIQVQRKKWAEAEDAYSKAIQKNPKLVGLYSSYALSLAENGKVGAAIDVYKQSFNQTKKVSDLAQIGALYMTAKKFREAVQVYTEVRKLAAYNPEPDCRLGLSYEALGETENARAGFGFCLKKAEGVKGLEHLVQIATDRLQKLPAANTKVATAKKSRRNRSQKK